MASLEMPKENRSSEPSSGLPLLPTGSRCPSETGPKPIQMTLIRLTAYESPVGGQATESMHATRRFTWTS